MDAATFMALAMACAPLVDPATASALVATESSFDPHAIGIVRGVLEQQPRSTAEALSTSDALQRQGWNYSVGLAQINVRNFRRVGLTPTTAFEPCRNLAAMQLLLLDCFVRATAQHHLPQPALRRALSCYYSGNFVTGFAHGYVGRVVKTALSSPRLPTAARPSTKESS